MDEIEKESEELLRKTKKLSSEYSGNTTYDKLLEDLVGFKESIPNIKTMKAEYIRERHWDKLMKLVGLDIQIDLKTISL